MNVVCLTQAASLEPLYRAARELQGQDKAARIGVSVTDRAYFNAFLQRFPGFFERAARPVLEWEALERAAKGEPDLSRLRDIESRLGDPVLWPATVADRRVFHGETAAFRQDYAPRHSHRFMLRLVEETTQALETLFDETKPDVVLSFICVTVADYLGYRIARDRGIPFLNLRPTRISNHVHLAETIHEPAPSLQAAFAQRRSERRNDEWTELASRYVADVVRGEARYEGILQAPSAFESALSALRRFPKAVRTTADALFGVEPDPHATPPLRAAWHRYVVGPRRARALRRIAGSSGESFSGGGFALFPLHTEPEVTLLVYSRHCMNQIEVVRALAQSLPVGMTVLVKEHPVAIGKRTSGYYRKLLDIPGVALADPALSSRVLVERCSFVATIAGSIGLEAAFRGKPVLLFGHAPFEILPASMVRRVSGLEDLAREIKGLLEEHRPDTDAIVDYVATVLEASIPLDLYSRLLRRAATLRFASAADGVHGDHDAYQRDVAAFAEYVRASLVRLKPRLEPIN
jgi:hypothetical protein